MSWSNLLPVYFLDNLPLEVLKTKISLEE